MKDSAKNSVHNLAIQLFVPVCSRTCVPHLNRHLTFTGTLRLRCTVLQDSHALNTTATALETMRYMRILSCGIVVSHLAVINLLTIQLEA